MKYLFFVICLLSTTHIELRSQTNEKQKVTPYFAALVVSNIDSAIHWYTHYLPLKLRNRVDNPQRGFKQANVENEDILIELVELKSSVMHDDAVKSLPQGTRVVGFDKLGFWVADFDACYKEMQSKNARFLGRVVADQVSGKRMFIVTDPDGNLVQFFEK